MKRAIALVIAALATPASAYDINIRYGELPPVEYLVAPKIIHIPEPTTPEAKQARDEAIARWTDHCKPVGRKDAFGITRLTYAHPGCEFGEGE